MQQIEWLYEHRGLSGEGRENNRASRFRSMAQRCGRSARAPDSPEQWTSRRLWTEVSEAARTRTELRGATSHSRYRPPLSESESEWKSERAPTPNWCRRSDDATGPSARSALPRGAARVTRTRAAPSERGRAPDAARRRATRTAGGPRDVCPPVTCR